MRVCWERMDGGKGKEFTTEFAEGQSSRRTGRMTQMYRIVLVCKGVPRDAGVNAAHDIAKEFAQRPWQKNVMCVWDGSALTLQADSDYDENGHALRDEFSDAISACIAEAFDGDIELVSVTTI